MEKFVVIYIMMICFGQFRLTKSDCVYNLDDPAQRPSNMPFIFEEFGVQHYPLINNVLMIHTGKSIQLQCNYYNGENSISNVDYKIPIKTFQCTNARNSPHYYDPYNSNSDIFPKFGCKKSQFFLHEYENIHDTCPTDYKLAISYTVDSKNNSSNRTYVDIIGICFDYRYSIPIYTHIQLSNDISQPLNTLGGHVYSDIINEEHFEVVNEKMYASLFLDYFFEISYMDSRIRDIVADTYLTNKFSLIPFNLVNKNHLPIIFYESHNSRLLRFPAWRTLVEGNWAHLAEDIRTITFKYGSQRIIDIYSGTYGVLKIKDKSSVVTEVYIQDEPYYGRKVPVPQYIWNVVYESASQRAVAFIGRNYPEEISTSENIKCNNICRKIEWIYFKPNNSSLGEIICCEYNDFLKIVDFVPLLNGGDIELLTS